jgi:hypothetical protein
MMRTIVCALVAFVFVTGLTRADGKPQKNQMVKGTIKSVDADKAVLIVLQKLKNETVIRELDITGKTEITVGDKTVLGPAGLLLPGVKEGASVTVKCDKDVNVLSVKVK